MQTGDSNTSQRGENSCAQVQDGRGVWRFKIGDLSATALHDGTLVFPNDASIFGLGRSAADVAELLAAQDAATDEITLGLQPLLVEDGSHVMLFDTGVGDALGDVGGHLAVALATAGIAPEDVSDIFISHTHGDHVLGLLDRSGRPAFPQARIHISATEWAHFRGLDAEAAQQNLIEHHPNFVAAIEPHVVPFSNGQVLIPNVVTAVSLPGHTPGHTGYHIGTGTDAVLYIGDALHSSVISVHAPRWSNAFDEDRASAAANRESLLAEAADQSRRIYAVHFPFPGLGRIQRRGEGYAWVGE